MYTPARSRWVAVVWRIVCGLIRLVDREGSFPISEARSLQFRAEAFLLNKTNFATVSGTNSNSSGFGVFNATFPVRQIQLALKLVF